MYFWAVMRQCKYMLLLTGVPYHLRTGRPARTSVSTLLEDLHNGDGTPAHLPHLLVCAWSVENQQCAAATYRAGSRTKAPALRMWRS